MLIFLVNFSLKFICLLVLFFDRQCGIHCSSGFEFSKVFMFWKQSTWLDSSTIARVKRTLVTQNVLIFFCLYFYCVFLEIVYSAKFMNTWSIVGDFLLFKFEKESWVTFAHINCGCEVLFFNNPSGVGSLLTIKMLCLKFCWFIFELVTLNIR